MRLSEWAHGLERRLFAAAKETYDFALGDDLRTLLDPKRPLAERAIAGLSIASEFTGPEGRLLGKGLLKLGEAAAEHAVARLAGDALVAIEAKLENGDPIHTVSTRGQSLATRLESYIDRAETVLGEIHLGRGVSERVERTLEDARKTIADTVTAIDAAPEDRARAWERVAVDAARIAHDAGATYGIEGRLMNEAQKLRAAHETLAQTASLAIDVRDASAAHGDPSADAKPGRALVLFDPHLTRDQARALTAMGVSVATNEGDLRRLVASARAHGDVEIDAVASRGHAHAHASPWNGTAQWEGRVTSIGTDGGFEISTGRATYVTFDAKAAQALGVDTREMEVGNYVDISRDGDAAQTLRAVVAPEASALPRRAEMGHSQ